MVSRFDLDEFFYLHGSGLEIKAVILFQSPFTLVAEVMFVTLTD